MSIITLCKVGIFIQVSIKRINVEFHVIMKKNILEKKIVNFFCFWTDKMSNFIINKTMFLREKQC